MIVNFKSKVQIFILKKRTALLDTISLSLLMPSIYFEGCEIYIYYKKLICKTCYLIDLTFYKPIAFISASQSLVSMTF